MPIRSEDPGNSRHASAADLRAIEELLTKYQSMRTQLAGVLVGMDEIIEQLTIAILCKGHCILQGMPGLAKTLLVSSMASLMHLSFRRIQFTPDLMPSDITGTDVLEEDRTTGKRVFRFIPGPLFGNFILADEINRTPPKTQSALLEAMQERQLTIGGETFASCRNRFLCWPRRIPSNRKGHIRCPKRNWIVFCSGSMWVIRNVTKKLKSADAPQRIMRSSLNLS